MKILLIAVLLLIQSKEIFPADVIRESIVKIYTVYNKYNYYEPWQMVGQRSRTGSGSIIKGNRILTNAHIVSDRMFIQVKRSGKVKKYQAQVEFIAHDYDIAIIKVADDSFFSGVKPLDFGKLPEVRDKVAVYGFPIGGDELSITEGVVSRVQHTRYTHSKAHLLTCQIDAAINPGNSGGPVIKDGRIVGVAFQAGGGENIGYMVPVPIIKHFLRDIRDKQYDGIPELGLSYQKMENPDIREHHNLNTDQSGVLINKIFPDSPAESKLKPGDVILSVDGTDIENDGTIKFRKNERTQFAYIIQKKHIGESITFEVLRGTEIMHIEVILNKKINFSRLVPHEQYDTAPQYYIFGGLVFQPLTVNYLKEWGSNWWNRSPTNLINYYLYGDPEENRREVVVLTKVLADEVNTGYHNLNNMVITEVNSKKISTLSDLIKAIENHNEKYHILIDEGNYKIVIDREKAISRNPEILKKYKINSHKSAP